jgi:hypothetical protein
MTLANGAGDIGDSPRGCVSDCGFPIQSFPCAETYVGIHVKCALLLSNFNKKENWNVSTNCSKTLLF